MRTIDVLPCPVCPAEIEVSEEDPDASLDDLWWHLMQHGGTGAARDQLFAEAQRNARERVIR